MAISDDHCPICRQEIEIIVSAYRHRPWLDGKLYAQICMVCHEVPKTWEERDGQVVVFPWDPQQLRSVEDLVEDGFDKRRARISINAVRDKLRHIKGRLEIKPVGGVNILDTLVTEPIKIGA